MGSSPQEQVIMARLTRSAPYFPVADVDQSVTFYQEVLGLTVEYNAGSPAQFSICSRDVGCLLLG